MMGLYYRDLYMLFVERIFCLRGCNLDLLKTFDDLMVFPNSIASVDDGLKYAKFHIFQSDAKKSKAFD